MLNEDQSLVVPDVKSYLNALVRTRKGRDMALEIRCATQNDVPEIVQVKQLVWPDEASNAATVVAVLGQLDHATLVAILDGKVVGFVDSFLTRSAARQSRWEVDLLAVHPHAQGRGIAAQLVSLSTNAGRKMGASIASGLVGVRNVASKRTFARCGYLTDTELYHLYVSTTGVCQNPLLTTRAHTVPVYTLNYRGLWLEGPLTQSDFAVAQAIRTRERLDLVGAVISAREDHQIEAARSAGFVWVGDYHWWQLNLHKP